MDLLTKNHELHAETLDMSKIRENEIEKKLTNLPIESVFTPPYNLYRTIQPHNNVLTDFHKHGASLRKSIDIPFALSSNYTIMPTKNNKGYNLFRMSDHFSLHLPPFPPPNSPEGRDGFFVAGDTANFDDRYSAFHVIALPANTQLPIGFGIVNDGNQSTIFPTQPHILTRLGIQKIYFVNSISQLDWKWTGILKLKAVSEKPDDFVEGMNKNAHSVATSLHACQSSQVDEDLFTELGDLQEQLRISHYSRFSLEFAQRCIVCFEGMDLGLEKEEFRRTCEAAINPYLELLVCR